MAFTTIDDPSAHFHIQLYVGNESTNAITNNANAGNFQPDWWWGADRTGTSWNSIYDSSRGTTKQLNSNVFNSEYTVSTGLTSFDSNGFTLGSHDNSNGNSENHVAWQWKANGGTTSSNSDGSITSTVQANTTAGFSIVLWTGNGSDATIGHGLNSAPQMYVVKNRSDSADWRVGQTVSGNIMTAGRGYYMEWNDTKASTNPGSAVTWGSTPTAPTSSVFTVGSNNAHNGSGDNMLAYCFHSVKGYSKIGSYTGNGNADGPFVYTGFKPAWVMIKEVTATGSWHIFDNKRKVGNVSDSILYADLSNAEGTSQTGNPIDILSNGFKCRGGGNDTNLDGGTYLYMAFAEHPFVSSEGVPTTAR